MRIQIVSESEPRIKVKWGMDVEDTKSGQKEGKFIWYGKVSSSEAVVLVGELDVRTPVDVGAKWRVKSEWSS